MAVRVSLVVADSQCQEALDLILGSRLLLIGEPEFEQVEEHPEDRLAPLVDADPRPVDPERPELAGATTIRFVVVCDNCGREHGALAAAFKDDWKVQDGRILCFDCRSRSDRIRVLPVREAG